MSDLTPLEASAVTAARSARHHAYAPYSGRNVGAAVITSDDRVFSACNLENKSDALWVCAERSAIATAVAHGCRQFHTVVVAAPDGRFWPPCEKCRNVISEFAPNANIILCTDNGEFLRRTLGDLPARPFDLGEEFDSA
jgi:cytidine deaminase